MNKPIVYKYEENNKSIDVFFSQKNNDYQMINVTQMANLFGKNVADYLRLKSTKEYINEISNDMGIPISEVYQVVRGGKPSLQGTWMHEDLALDHAQWLSPKLKLWCNRKLKELLKIQLSYQITAEPNQISDHIFHKVQKENSKAIARKNYGVERDKGKIIEHYRDIMFKFTGLYPNQIKSWAKKNNIPKSIINAGAREIVRFVSADECAAISLLENMIACDSTKTIADVDELVPIVKKIQPFFKELIEIGYGDPDDLKKIKRNRKLMLKYNEKK